MIYLKCEIFEVCLLTTLHPINCASPHLAAGDYLEAALAPFDGAAFPHPPAAEQAIVAGALLSESPNFHVFERLSMYTRSY